MFNKCIFEPVSQLVRTRKIFVFHDYFCHTDVVTVQMHHSSEESWTVGRVLLQKLLVTQHALELFNFVVYFFLVCV